MRRLACAVVVLLSGCDLYFTDGDGDDDPCVYPATGVEGDVAPANELRNPYTGECEPFGYPYPCDGVCGPCPPTGAEIAQPDWGSCYSSCEGLAETACLAAPGCFAAYTEYPTEDRAAEFRGCWQTAPSGPISSGSCANLDAQECSRHDNCTAHYDASPSEFMFCAPEHPKSCTEVTCAPGSHCEEHCDPSGCQPMCVPDADACAAVDCGPGWACVTVCQDGTGGACGTCGAQCVPDGTCEAITTESACATRPDCVRVYEGDDCTCYPGYCECNVLTYERCETQ